MYQGLVAIAFRDAIKLNDGERIIRFWRIQLPTLYARGHHNYVILTHRLLTDSAQGDRNAFDLKWNRTVNANGGKGRNISVDLKMEQFNRAFKGTYLKAFFGFHLSNLIPY